MYTDDQNGMLTHSSRMDPELGHHENENSPPSYDAVTEPIWQPRTDDDDVTESSAHDFTETAIVPSAPFLRQDSWRAVVGRNSAARGSKEPAVNKGPGLKFYCEDCDDVRFSINLRDPASYRGSVVTVDGDEMSAPDFAKRELPRGPPIADWKKQQNKAWLYVSVFFHFGMILCLGMAYFVYYHEPKVVHQLGLGLCFGFAGFCFLFILLELCIAYARGYAMNIKSQSEAQEYAHILRHSAPRLYVKVTRYETTRSSRGVTNPNAVAWSEHTELPVNYWRDLSQELDFSHKLLDSPRCQVHVRVAVAFVNQETLAMCQRMAASLKAEAEKIEGNRTEVKTYIKLPGLKDHDRLTVTSGANWCEWLYIPILYWLTGPTILHWLFRYWFHVTATKANFTIIKVVGKSRRYSEDSSPLPSASLEYDGYNEHYL